MALKREQRELIRRFIIENVREHPHDIVKITAIFFGITRQSVHNYTRKLIKNGVLEAEGKTRDINYKLKAEEFIVEIAVNSDLKEDEVWRSYIGPKLPDLKKNVYDICYYGFTEMMNNIIDHSESEKATIKVRFNAVEIEFLLMDYGIGIFRKIQKFLQLEDPKYAILELAKGKFTTDKARHTGEGIYFTSRMCDSFDILSENIYFHGQKDKDWLADKDKFNKGTVVFMNINRNSAKTSKGICDDYSPSEEDYGFSKTTVPVKLLKHEGEELISRSQAKRLIMRFNKFKEVILDFEGVTTIGQPFADEVFRVFQTQNPNVHLMWININEDIDRMIRHVLGHDK